MTINMKAKNKNKQKNKGQLSQKPPDAGNGPPNISVQDPCTLRNIPEDSKGLLLCGIILPYLEITAENFLKEGIYQFLLKITITFSVSINSMVMKNSSILMKRVALSYVFAITEHKSLAEDSWVLLPFTFNPFCTVSGRVWKTPAHTRVRETHRTRVS